MADKEHDEPKQNEETEKKQEDEKKDDDKEIKFLGLDMATFISIIGS